MKTEAIKLKFVFVHGLSGWGHYDKVNWWFPYWGLSGGSVIKYLKRLGYDCCDASIAPTGSAWDRACELYAQLTGSRVDYGKAHSLRYGHERFGRDFSGEPLTQGFDQAKLVLIGHSFGGATIRLFSEILIHGCKEEADVTDPEDLSPFFRGTDPEKIFAMVALAAPHNGTTAYDMYEDPSFDVHSVEIPEKYLKASQMMSRGTRAKTDGRSLEDYASFDMHIDMADKLNQKIATFENVFYFSYPCCVTSREEDGRCVPNAALTEVLFMKSALIMSAYSGKTKEGMIIDSSWQENDGLVNVVSAMAPSHAPSRKYTKGDPIEPGIWHIMPVQTGDHMYFQGGMTKRVKIKPFYKELVEMISGLE